MVTAGDKIIDSRDIISRIEELETERESLVEEVTEAREALSEYEPDEEENEAALTELKAALVDAACDLDEWDGADELKSLKEFAEEGENSTSEWSYGATLIHRDYFTEYCQDLCEEIGDLPKGIPSYIVIDWDATADNLLHDYSSLTWDGETYYVR